MGRDFYSTCMHACGCAHAHKQSYIFLCNSKGKTAYNIEVMNGTPNSHDKGKYKGTEIISTTATLPLRGICADKQNFKSL